jgi:hypothetical protein
VTKAVKEICGYTMNAKVEAEAKLINYNNINYPTMLLPLTTH